MKIVKLTTGTSLSAGAQHIWVRTLGWYAGRQINQAASRDLNSTAFRILNDLSHVSARTDAQIQEELE